MTCDASYSASPAAAATWPPLRTKAVRHDDGWHVQGQKVWTTLAQHSRYGILLARTNPDAPKHPPSGGVDPSRIGGGRPAAEAWERARVA